MLKGTNLPGKEKRKSSHFSLSLGLIPSYTDVSLQSTTNTEKTGRDVFSSILQTTIVDAEEQRGTEQKVVRLTRSPETAFLIFTSGDKTLS